MTDESPASDAVRPGMARDKHRWYGRVLALVTCGAAAGLAVFGRSPAAFLAKVFLLLVGGSVVVLWTGGRLFGRARAGRLHRNLVLACVATLMSLIAGEWIVRYLYRDVTTTGNNASWFSYHYWAVHPPSMNRFGFREREFGLVPPAGRYRIAIIGDSFTYGQGITEDARVSNLLEERLRRNGRPFEVLNFGIPGAETVDELETLAHYVIPSHPDFLLLQWYVNDIDDHTTRRSSPRGLIPWWTLHRFLQRHSVLYYLLEQQAARIRPDPNPNPVEKRFNEADGSYARRYRDLLARFLSTARSAGIPVAIVAYPPLENPDGTPEGFPNGKLLDVVQEVCRDEHIICADEREVLAGIQPMSRLWADRLDGHPGRMANEITANHLLRTLGGTWDSLATVKLHGTF